MSWCCVHEARDAGKPGLSSGAEVCTHNFAEPDVIHSELKSAIRYPRRADKADELSAKTFVPSLEDQDGYDARLRKGFGCV